MKHINSFPKKKHFSLIALALLISLLLVSCSFALSADPGSQATDKPSQSISQSITTVTGSETDKETAPQLDENGSYTTKEDVALYIHLYGRLPRNFITKSEARKLGWSGGGLERYAPGKCIGGDTFQNREGLLPKKAGRTYTECDIDTLGASSRGAKRIVFSNDGLVYYTADHYESFTLMYGKP